MCEETLISFRIFDKYTNAFNDSRTDSIHGNVCNFAFYFIVSAFEDQRKGKRLTVLVELSVYVYIRLWRMYRPNACRIEAARHTRMCRNFSNVISSNMRVAHLVTTSADRFAIALQEASPPPPIGFSSASSYNFSRAFAIFERYIYIL